MKDDPVVMCLGKLSHDSKRDAEKATRGKRVELQSYRCKICGKWHVGKPRAKNVPSLKLRSRP